jgi:hypothetical protein
MNELDWHLFLPWLAPLAGCALLSLGALAICAPRLGGKAFGLPSHGPALPFVVVVGARDVGLGLAILGLWAQGASRPVAIAILSLVVVAVADALVVFRYGMRQLCFVHGAGALGAALYGAWLWGN